MDTIKHITIEKLKSRNLYADLFIPLMRRPGFKHGVEIVYPTICIQQIGVSTTGKDELKKMTFTIQKLTMQKIPHVLLNDRLTFKPSNKLIQAVKSVIATNQNDWAGIKQSIKQLSSDHSLFIRNLKPHEQDFFIRGLIYTLESFFKSENAINNSKIVNIIVKLIYWTELYLSEAFMNKNTLLTKDYINPKVFYFGSMTNQESYFIVLMCQLGLDTIYFNFDKINYDHWSKALLAEGQLIEHTLTDDNNIWKVLLSEKKSTENSIRENKTPSKITAPPAIKSSKTQSSTMAISKKPIHSEVLINPKKFNGNLEDLIHPLTDRSGYVGLPAPILPVYFIRYIGMDSDKNIYKNRIFHIDQNLSAFSENYLKFDNHIPKGTYNILNQKTALVWNQFDMIKAEQLKGLTEYLNGIGLFSFIKDQSLRDQCYISLLNILNLAFNDSHALPASKVKNLVIKLAGWLSDHKDTLFNHYNFDQTKNPKVLYYGDIKTHEALYLIFLFYMGIDVLYIHTLSDDLFESLDPDSKISTVKVLDQVQPLEPFPEGETLIQHQTTAYQASEEIAQIVHNDQDGVYLPWQFETYKTMPITLKTTYEEWLILWNEDARIRSGFKVEKNTVYIPNMFVKISGTQAEIENYWKLIAQLKEPPLTTMYCKLPFSNIHYNNQTLSAMDLVFENHSDLSFEKLKKHRAYKFSHLSDSLQLQIFEKLCSLLKNNLLIQSNFHDFQLKLVFTILNMDDELLKLIQSFDYPSSIPKLIIYDPDETTFSESDAMILSFLYLFGFDICVLTPTGYNNFETFIDESYYSVFKLPQKQFNLELPDLKRYSSSKASGFWSNIFR